MCIYKYTCVHCAWLRSLPLMKCIPRVLRKDLADEAPERLREYAQIQAVISRQGQFYLFSPPKPMFNLELLVSEYT